MKKTEKLIKFAYDMYETGDAPKILGDLIKYLEVVKSEGHFHYFMSTYIGFESQYIELIKQLPQDLALNFEAALKKYLNLKNESNDQTVMNTFKDNDAFVYEHEEEIKNEIISISDALYHIYGNGKVKSYVFSLFLFAGVIGVLFTLIFGALSAISVALYKLQLMIWGATVTVCTVVYAYFHNKTNEKKRTK